MAQHENYGINRKKLLSQRWAYYITLIVWPLYLLIIPVVWQWQPLLAIIFIIFPGAYLYTWLAFLVHESWHHYVPGISHKLFYTVFSYFLLTDPQFYHLVHGSHHSKVNSWDDIELHPFGYIHNSKRR